MNTMELAHIGKSPLVVRLNLQRGQTLHARGIEQIRVVQGRLWLTEDHTDRVFGSGQSIYGKRLTDDALITAIGDAPVIIEVAHAA